MLRSIKHEYGVDILIFWYNHPPSLVSFIRALTSQSRFGTLNDPEQDWQARLRP